jgi:MoxR-like ATPase
MDRFMLKVVVGYPNRDQELLILDRMSKTRQKIEVRPVTSREDIMAARATIDDIYVDRKVQEYIVDLVMATRKPQAYGLQLDELIQYGASPRATIFLTLAAKANAFLHGRGHVVPQDIKEMALDVLRHRVILTYEAEAEEKTSDEIISTILNAIPVP